MYVPDSILDLVKTEAYPSVGCNIRRNHLERLHPGRCNHCILSEFIHLERKMILTVREPTRATLDF
jgi:hypothetical protein